LEVHFEQFRAFRILFFKEIPIKMNQI